MPQLVALDPVKAIWMKFYSSFASLVRGSIDYAKGMLSVGNKEAHDCEGWKVG